MEKRNAADRLPIGEKTEGRPPSNQRIELDIITGFLGAGKTTLINKMLAEGFGGSGTVLLENEFGDVPIDSDLVASNGIAVRTMATGCICCTLKGDFVTNLIAIAEEYRPQRIIVEPTGLANRADILDLCKQAAETVPHEINAVITVVSAENLIPLVAVGGEFFSDQLRQARFLLVSCSQLVEESDLGDVLDLLEEHANATVPVLCRDWADVSALEIMTQAEQAWHEGSEGVEQGECDPDVHRHPVSGADSVVERVSDAHHDHEHAHGGHHADPATGCFSLSYTPTRDFEKSDLDTLVNLLDGGSAGLVFRAKGFLDVAGARVLFEYVYGHARWGICEYSGFPKFVLIGKDLDKRAFSAFFGDETQ